MQTLGTLKKETPLRGRNDARKGVFVLLRRDDNRDVFICIFVHTPFTKNEKRDDNRPYNLTP